RQKVLKIWVARHFSSFYDIDRQTLFLFPSFRKKIRRREKKICDYRPFCLEKLNGYTIFVQSFKEKEMIISYMFLVFN
ncbi:MAG: hypothetical protein LBR86_02610, partial [Tannerella sp.]|nr:hypothetical protein [Tannerella sp.]